MPGTAPPTGGIQGFWAQIQTLTQRIASLEVWQRAQPAAVRYFAAAGKTTVTDADFGATPPNGMTAVHYDSTAGKTYLSARANGTWHVMAGPV